MRVLLAACCLLHGACCILHDDNISFFLCCRRSCISSMLPNPENSEAARTGAVMIE